MPENMKNVSLLLTMIGTILAVLVIEAAYAHALVVEKDEILPKDDSNTDWLEQEAIYRLLKALYTPRAYPNFASSVSSDELNEEDSMKRGSPRSIDHMEDRIRYLTWCKKMKIASCYM